MSEWQPIEPCQCGNADLAVYRYDNGGRHVECDKCWYLGPCAGSVKQAIKAHNVSRACARTARDHNTPSQK